MMHLMHHIGHPAHHAVHALTSKCRMSSVTERVIITAATTYSRRPTTPCLSPHSWGHRASSRLPAVEIGQRRGSGTQWRTDQCWQLPGRSRGEGQWNRAGRRRGTRGGGGEREVGEGEGEDKVAVNIEMEEKRNGKDISAGKYLEGA